MSTAVLILNFGEPDTPDLEKVEPYLERIFLQNSRLDGPGAEVAAARAKKLASDRAPSLVEEYERIGGSPLNAQADNQARALETSLGGMKVYSAFQFTAPWIREALEAARADGVDTLVALPVYPMCGQSTTVAALDDLDAALAAMRWSPRVVSITGWHKHPDYVSMRVEGVRAFCTERGLRLDDPNTVLYFSVHGTPVAYLRDGPRYDRYVAEHCAEIARGLNAERYEVGFQNHENRRIAWTQPGNETRIPQLDERTLVVVPISFMHEQSETLAELDHELTEFAAEHGKELHRVPVPHDDPAFPRLLAALVLSALSDGTGLSACRCRPGAETWCTNGLRELPPSPYVPLAGKPV